MGDEGQMYKHVRAQGQCRQEKRQGEYVGVEKANTITFKSSNMQSCTLEIWIIQYGEERNASLVV